ncbi:MAG: amidohydrolase family protein [Phycisphaerae bacterium]|nr:amidohydrolase family protein [Phycisphaerae bacterium]
MIIDAHQHVFWHGKNDADLVADLNEQGIDKAWLLTWEIPPNEDTRPYHHVFNPERLRPDGSHPGLSLADALRAYRNYPDRFVLGYCPDPNIEDAVKWFATAVEMHGVRICGEWKYRMLVNDPRNLELFREAGELHCPVVLHFDAPYLKEVQNGPRKYFPLWYGGEMEHLARTLEACPETTFLGHGPGFWREISGLADDDPGVYPAGPVKPGGRLISLLETYPNLYVDLSAGSGIKALKRDAQQAREFLIRFADRILFARDFYGGDLMEFLSSLSLPEEVRENIFSANALKLVPV